MAPPSARDGDRGADHRELTAATRDIARQRQHDQGWPQNLSLLAARVRSVADAQRASLEHLEGALPALRQSLVDLAACAEGLADSLGPPKASAGR